MASGTVSGKADKASLPGVSVQTKNKTVQTDASGKFSIEAAPGDDLTFSYVGMKSLTLNNWQYAQVVPAQGRRGAMTLPRELSLKPVDGKFFISSTPVNELKQLIAPAFSKENLSIDKELDLSSELKGTEGRFKLDISFASVSDFSINLSNDKGEELIIGYEKASNNYYIDRTSAGKSAFEKGFAKRHTAPRISISDTIDLSFILMPHRLKFLPIKG